MTRNTSSSTPWLATLSVHELRMTFVLARAKQSRSQRGRGNNVTSDDTSTIRKAFRAA